MIEQWYSLDPPVKDLYLFFGRQTEIKWVTDQLDQGQRLLAVYGSRRIGKTALLHALIDRLPRQYLPVYLDADTASVWEAASPLFEIAAELGRKVREQTNARILQPEALPFAEDPLGALRAYVRGLDLRVEDRQLVLLVDNAECIAPEWLHILLQSPVPVLVTAESYEHLSKHISDVPFTPPSITLGSLSNEAGTDLVKALITPRSPIDPWAVRRMLEITSNHPYYVHIACRVLLECCTYKSPITPSQVEDALQAMLEVPIAEFIVEWQSSLPREQIVLAVFGALRGHGGVATQYDIQKSCARYGLYPPLKTIAATIDNLAQRNVLEKLGSNSYRFRLELFRLWIDHHYSPEELCRKQAWQFRQSMLGNWSSELLRSFAQRRTLWLSVAAVGFVVLLVVAQPAMWRRRAAPTPTPRQVVPAAQASRTRTETPAIETTPTPAAPAVVLPGYDLLIMSRTESQSPWQIYALNSHTGDRLRLMTTNSNERTPKWSPDGNLIAFASDRDGDRDIYVMTLGDVMNLGADYQPLPLTQNEVPDWQPAWAPDGKRIAFSSYQDENWEIYVVHADGTNLARMTDHPENDFSPTWAPDGKKILFVSRRYGDADLFVLDLASEEISQLTTSELDEYDPAWSPDGQWIAFVTQIGSQSDLFVMRADGSDPVNLTDSPYADDFQPVWTPDSAQLIFVSYTAARGDYDLFVIQRDGSGMTVLNDDDSDTLAPSLRHLE